MCFLQTVISTCCHTSFLRLSSVDADEAETEQECHRSLSSTQRHSPCSSHLSTSPHAINIIRFSQRLLHTRPHAIIIITIIVVIRFSQRLSKGKKGKGSV